MLTKEVLKELSAFFEPHQISWKPQATNKDKTKALAVAYVDARDVQNRLDKVVGGDWEFRWEKITNTEVKGILTVCGVTREDVGEMGEGEQGKSLKAAVSDAFKRAAVQFGVARYLYYLPVSWVEYDEAHKKLVRVPDLPKWAIPTIGSTPEPPTPAVGAEEAAHEEEKEPPKNGKSAEQPPKGKPWYLDTEKTRVIYRMAEEKLSLDNGDVNALLGDDWSLFGTGNEAWEALKQRVTQEAGK